MPDDDTIRRAEDLYVWRSVAEASQERKPGLTFRDLYRYLTDPMVLLSSEQQGLLFTDRRLRSDFQRLKRDLVGSRGYGEIPPAAAAADRGLGERRFEGGTVRIVASEHHAGQVFVVLQFDDPANSPRALVLHSSEESAKLLLDKPDEEGVVQLLLDADNEENARLIRLLRNPQATGILI
jgi:hypothetical protein